MRHGSSSVPLCEPLILQFENWEDMPYPFRIPSYFLLLKSGLKGQSITELTHISYLSSFCFWWISRDSECPQFSKLSASCWQATTLFLAASSWCRNVSYLAQSCFWRKNDNIKKGILSALFSQTCLLNYQSTAKRQVISWWYLEMEKLQRMIGFYLQRPRGATNY